LTVSTHDKTTTTTWDSLTKATSDSLPGAGGPLSTTITGVLTDPGHANRREFGPEGAAINTADDRRRLLHGGGRRSDWSDPNQTLIPTHGCTRLHNQDAITLGNFEKQYGMPIEWERTQ
jgi:hypothetical protein